MTNTIDLAAEPRERAGKGASRAARREGKVPAVIYGNKLPPVLVSLDPKALTRECDQPGFFTRVCEVKLGQDKVRVLPRDVQRHPVNDRPIHVDLMRVSDNTRIRVAIPVAFENEGMSPGLKRGGVLNIVRHEIEVTCLVANIPERILVDLSGLDIGDSVHISKIKLPEGVRPTIARDFTIASVAAPTLMKTAEEEAAEAAAAAAAAAEAAAAGPEGGAGAGAAPGAAPAAGDAKKGGAKPEEKKKEEKKK